MIVHASAFLDPTLESSAAALDFGSIPTGNLALLPFAWALVLGVACQIAGNTLGRAFAGTRERSPERWPLHFGLGLCLLTVGTWILAVTEHLTPIGSLCLLGVMLGLALPQLLSSFRDRGRRALVSLAWRPVLDWGSVSFSVLFLGFGALQLVTPAPSEMAARRTLAIAELLELEGGFFSTSSDLGLALPHLGSLVHVHGFLLPGLEAEERWRVAIGFELIVLAAIAWSCASLAVRMGAKSKPSELAFIALAAAPLLTDGRWAGGDGILFMPLFLALHLSCAARTIENPTLWAIFLTGALGGATFYAGPPSLVALLPTSLGVAILGGLRVRSQMCSVGLLLAYGGGLISLGALPFVAAKLVEGNWVYPWASPLLSQEGPLSVYELLATTGTLGATLQPLSSVASWFFAPETLCLLFGCLLLRTSPWALRAIGVLLTAILLCTANFGARLPTPITWPLSLALGLAALDSIVRRSPNASQRLRHSAFVLGCVGLMLLAPSPSQSRQSPIPPELTKNLAKHRRLLFDSSGPSLGLLHPYIRLELQDRFDPRTFKTPRELAVTLDEFGIDSVLIDRAQGGPTLQWQVLLSALTRQYGRELTSQGPYSVFELSPRLPEPEGNYFVYVCSVAPYRDGLYPLERLTVPRATSVWARAPHSAPTPFALPIAPERTRELLRQASAVVLGADCSQSPVDRTVLERRFIVMNENEETTIYIIPAPEPPPEELTNLLLQAL